MHIGPLSIKCIEILQLSLALNHVHKKQKVHWLHWSSENQFQSIHTFVQMYDYTYTCTITFIISFVRFNGPLFGKTRVYFTQRCFVFSLVEIGPVVLEKIIKFYQCTFNISLLSPLGKGSVLTLEQTWNPLHPRMLYD